MSTKAVTNGYVQAARTKFDALLRVYDSPLKESKATYWKLGNSFDTMIDFLERDDGQANEVATIVVKQYSASLKALGGYDAAWFDDLGWWTIAAHRAAQKTFFTSGSQQAFRTITSDCWSRFTANAPFVWARRGLNTFSDYRPAVDDGVWNEYWSGTSPTFPGPKDGNPQSGTLGGLQNTVTNAVYLIAAQRLSATDPNAKIAAEREFGFLNTWFGKQPNPLWWKQNVPEPAALVRERVSHFFNGNAAAKFQTDWAWTGDQGLIFGALTDRMSLMSGGPDEPTALLELAKQLLAGVRQSVVKNRLLQNWTTSGSVPNNDIDDYDTGKGVFWRYVLHAWRINSDLRAFLKRPEYQEFVRVNADAAKGPIDPKEVPLDALTNDVAVLVAASMMLN